MPSIETFLLASSLLSLRQAAEQVMSMLKHARTLVMRRQARRDRRRLYWPRKINWNRFLRSGGEQDVMTLPENARKEVRTGTDKQEHKGNKPKHKEHDDDSHSESEDTSPVRRDEEANPRAHPTAQVSTPTTQEPKAPMPDRKPSHPKKYSLLWWRAQSADFMESVANSEHSAYALKLTIAVMLVSWIAFYGPLNGWFNSMRVVWAPLQLVLVFEVAIGSSLWIFFIRAFGVIFGCVWGYASFEIGRGNLVALVVILVIGIIPSAYVQLGTPYVKAGMISIVSMCIVALCTLPRYSHYHPALTPFISHRQHGIPSMGELCQTPRRLPHRRHSRPNSRSNPLPRPRPRPAGRVSLLLRQPHSPHARSPCHGLRVALQGHSHPLKETPRPLPSRQPKGPKLPIRSRDLPPLLSLRTPPKG